MNFEMHYLIKNWLMNRNGPVIVIEDDADDQQILKQVLKKLNYSNKIIFF